VVPTDSYVKDGLVLSQATRQHIRHEKSKAQRVLAAKQQRRAARRDEENAQQLLLQQAASAGEDADEDHAPAALAKSLGRDPHSQTLPAGGRSLPSLDHAHAHAPAHSQSQQQLQPLPVRGRAGRAGVPLLGRSESMRTMGTAPPQAQSGGPSHVALVAGGAAREEIETIGSTADFVARDAGTQVSGVEVTQHNSNYFVRGSGINIHICFSPIPGENTPL
jgi:hypothetical protein